MLSNSALRTIEEQRRSNQTDASSVDTLVWIESAGNPACSLLFSGNNRMALQWLERITMAVNR
jgi:hypothetical protein